MIQDRVREAGARRLLFLPHAIRQMNKPERMISAAEVREVVLQGEVIEDYPEDARGHSCLLTGETALGRTSTSSARQKRNILPLLQPISLMLRSGMSRGASEERIRNEVLSLSS